MTNTTAQSTYTFIMTLDAVPAEVLYNLYGGTWGKDITKEATKHPAKFSKKLVYWIVRHGLERGYWNIGDLLLDPFGGVGLGGIAATDLGLRWLGVELEPRFVQQGIGNFALHTEKWLGQGRALPDLLQGDSRRLGAVLDEYFMAQDSPAGVISSPPYANRVDDNGTDKPEYSVIEGMGGGKGYGRSEGQIGAMYGDGVASGAVTSPPFSQPDTRDRHPVQDGSVSDFMTRAATADRQGVEEGNIAHLPYSAPKGGDVTGSASGVVTSPPYEGAVVKMRSGHLEAERLAAKGLTDHSFGMTQDALSHDQYGKTEGNIGNGTGETYWDAVRSVYQELHRVLPVGGVVAIVVKDFVRNKARVPLCDMTLQLLQGVGFVPLERSICMLYSLDPKTGETKAHKGFFRRLAEKNGSPPIDYEEVLWLCKMQGEGAGGTAQ